MAEYGPVNDLTSSSWPTTDLFSFGLRPDAAQYRPRHQIRIRFSSGARIKSSISRSDARVGNLERPDRQTQAKAARRRLPFYKSSPAPPDGEVPPRRRVGPTVS